MKKKLLIIIPIAVVLLVALVVLGFLIFSGNEFDSGRVVKCNNGAVVFVDEDGQFWQMITHGMAKSQAAGLKTGDRVTVLRSTAMAMSYPGQCAVKLCIKTGSTDDGAIPQSVFDELERIGWLGEPNSDEADRLPDETDITVEESEEKATETELPETVLEFPKENLDDKTLVEILNSQSDLFFDFLVEKTVKEIYEFEADFAGNGYFVMINDDYAIDLGDRYEYETYRWIYSFTHYPNEDSKGWFATKINTDNPYAYVCGIKADAGVDKIRENYESKYFDVIVDGDDLIAKRGGLTVTYVIEDGKTVELEISIAVGKKTTTIYY